MLVVLVVLVLLVVLVVLVVLLLWLLLSHSKVVSTAHATCSAETTNDLAKKQCERVDEKQREMVVSDIHG